MVDLENFRTGSKQVCISMSLTDYFFIKKTGFSPSRLMRKAINDLRNDKSKDDLEEMYVKTEKQAHLIQLAMQFLENEGNTERFFQYKDDKEKEELMAHKKEKLKENEKQAKEENKIEPEVEKEAKEILKGEVVGK